MARFKLDMNPGVIAALIREVKDNPLIYDFTLVDFRDMTKKNAVWKQIANKLDVPNGEIVAWKWKNLRDSYSKYKKHLMYPTHDPFSRKFVHWRWAPMMTFLDPYIRTPRDTRDQGFPVLSPKNTSLIDDPLPDDTLPDNTLSNNDNSDESDEEPPKQTINPTAPTQTCKATPLKPEQDLSYSSFGVISSSRKIESDTACDSRKRKIPETIFIDETPLESPQPERTSFDKLDVTDYLFLNYSETFKRLGRKRQALLKLKMAKMFAQAELEELNNDPIKCKIQIDDSD